ncbi:hypothetical protein RB195_021831 [Necator americanus]|uniref:Uncharacterized protein n=1 Tax=Necator americanus TaxID=51031 RepID=A0ABR1EFG8_NECAM
MLAAAETGQSISYSIENADGKDHSRLLLRSLRQPGPPATSPSEGRWTSHSRGSPVRNTTCYHDGKKSYGTRPGQNKTRTLEKPFTSTHQHPGEALYTLSVEMQGS